jgi:hypothetical protein
MALGSLIGGIKNLVGTDFDLSLYQTKKIASLPDVLSNIPVQRFHYSQTDSDLDEKTLLVLLFLAYEQ